MNLIIVFTFSREWMKIGVIVNLMACSKTDGGQCHVMAIQHSYSEPHIHRITMERRCDLHRWCSSPAHLSDNSYFILSAAHPCSSVRNVATQTVDRSQSENAHRDHIPRTSEGPLPDLVQARSTRERRSNMAYAGRMLRRMADDFDSYSRSTLQAELECFSPLSWLRSLYHLIFR